jgi:S1-C subfamily serine protease
VGNPHGLGDSITVGVVSAIGRSAKMQNGATLRNLIQTDAAINIGNSGGALLNLDGELMGINVSLLPSAKGIAFAISADQVAASLQRCVGRAPPPNPLPPIDPEFTLPPPPPSLPKDRVAVPAPDGVGLPPPAVVTPMRPEDLGLTVEDTGTRVVVKKVLRNTPAEIAGLLVGDVILEIDGRPVEAAMELALAFSASEPGRGFYLQIRRGNEEKQAVLIAPK